MFRLFLWLLLMWTCGVQALQPRFFPAESAGGAPVSDWRPSLDSLDSRLHGLNGAWTWSSKDGGGGACVVPGCWSGFDGELLFTRSFALPEKGVQSVWRLWFGGVSYACRVSVNGKFLDRHEGGSDPFELEIPEGVLLFGGANTLEVRVDSRLSARQTVPLKTQSGDPASYGGIYRDVWLLESPRLRLTDLSWRLVGQGAAARLAVDVQVRNQELLGVDSLKTAPDVAVEAVLRGPDGVVLATGVQALRARAQESVALKVLLAGATLPRWSPQSPQLLDLTVALTQGGRALHRLRQKVGVKELGQRGARLSLNGQPFFMQGLSYVADHPRWGMALPVSQLIRDLESMKNMGVNTILHMRGAPHPALAELCDRLGLLLVTELPVWQVPPRLVARDSFRQAALAQARNLVRQGRTHACWLGLSLGSGLDFSDPATAEWIRQVQVLRQEAAFALTAGGFFSHEGVLPEPEGLDFLLLEPFGQRARHETPTLKMPVVLSRVGWPVEIGNLEGYEHPYGELHQAWAIQSTVGAALGAWQSGRKGAPAGTVVHSFADWRGGRPLLAAPPGQDALLVSLGLHNEDRVARSGAKELARLYSGEAASTLSRGEFEPLNPPAFPLAGFALLILLVIGWKQNKLFGQNLRRSFIHSHGFFTDIRDRRVFQFGQAMFILVLVSGALSLVGSGWLHLLRKSPYLDHVLGLMVVQEPLLQWIHRLAWNPVESMVQLALALMGGQILFALGLRVLGLLSNARFTFRQAITLLAWSSTSLLFTLPIGIVFQPLMQGAGARGFTLFLLALLALWHAVRLFKALRIAFEGRFWGMFALMGVLGLALLVLVLVWYERSQSLFEYLDYYRRVYGGGA